MIDKKDEIKNTINKLFKNITDLEDTKQSSTLKPDTFKLDLLKNSINKVKEYNKTRVEVETSNELKSKLSLFKLTNSSLKIKENFIRKFEQDENNFLDYDKVYLDIVVYLINLNQKDESRYDGENDKAVSSLKFDNKIDRFILDAIILEVFDEPNVVYDCTNFVFYNAEGK